MSRYGRNPTFEIGEIASKTITHWEVPTEALTNDPLLFPQVLSTPALINRMQQVTLMILTQSFKHVHCEIAVPGRISITHSAPVCPDASLTLTTEFKGKEKGNTFKFVVTVTDVYHGIVATGEFWNTVACSVNLSCAAFLRQPPEQEIFFAWDRAVPDCSDGRTGGGAKPASPFTPKPAGPPRLRLRLTPSPPPPPCRLCWPVPRPAWHGPTTFPHTLFSRGFLHAVHHGTPQLVARCLARGVSVQPYLDSALYAATIASRPEIIDALVRGIKGGGVRANPRAWKSQYLSFGGLLHLAVQESTPETVQALLRHGVNPNARDDEYYWTPLHHAARGGNLKLVGILLDAGADPNVCEDEEWTSLHFAVEGGHLRIAKLLVRRGAHIEATNGKRDTPLMMAVRLGNRDMARALLECGCNPDLGEGRRGSAMAWLAGGKVRDLSGPVRCLRP